MEIVAPLCECTKTTESYILNGHYFVVCECISIKLLFFFFKPSFLLVWLPKMKILTLWPFVGNDFFQAQQSGFRCAGWAALNKPTQPPGAETDTNRSLLATVGSKWTIVKDSARCLQQEKGSVKGRVQTERGDVTYPLEVTQ